MDVAAETRSSIRDMTIERVPYLGHPNCYRLSNGTIEVVVTTDIGPRIVHYGFVDGENMLGVYPQLSTSTPWGDWKPWAGHRLWVAPEAMPRSYAPDNSPISFKAYNDATIRLVQPPDQTGVQKEIGVTVAAEGSLVLVDHAITNCLSYEIEAAPWAITIVRSGTTVLPLEPWRSHDEMLLPAQPIVRWHFTDLADPRFSLGAKYIRLHADPRLVEPQKIGLHNGRGWCAHLAGDMLFVKRFDVEPVSACTDCGSNNEAYVAGDYMELETVGTLQRLQPGGSLHYVEQWQLFNGVDAVETEEELDKVLGARVTGVGGGQR
jgi:hypothetical protein